MGTPIADLIRSLAAAGCSLEQIIIAVESQEKEAAEREQTRMQKNADRQRRWREKHGVSKKIDVTLRNVTDDRNVTSVTEETPDVVSIISNTSTLTDSQRSKEGVGGRAGRGCRLPEDFGLTVGDREFAVTQLRPERIQEELAKFIDYWSAAAGRNAVKRDWHAAWRTWVRNAVQFSARGSLASPRPGSREARNEEATNALKKLRNFANGAGSSDHSGASSGTNISPDLRLPLNELP